MTLEEQIASAETALHNLLVGQLATVVVDQNGERVEFNRTSVAQLKQYIATLKATSTPGPMTVWF